MKPTFALPLVTRTVRVESGEGENHGSNLDCLCCTNCIDSTSAHHHTTNQGAGSGRSAYAAIRGPQPHLTNDVERPSTYFLAALYSHCTL